MDWIKRNKATVGLVFTIAGIYVWNFGCLGLESYCIKIAAGLTNLGTFLVGAGVLNSDLREKVVQGVVKPEELKNDGN